MTNSTSTPIGLLGLGLAGSALSARLLAAGYTVYGYDPHPAAQPPGVVRLNSERAVAAACRCVLLSLPGPAEVAAVLANLDSAVEMIIDTTTGDPAAVEAAATSLASRGIAYLDATLGGSSRQIAAGEALVICGADPAAFTRAEPILLAISPQLFHAGPPGTGTRMKLVFNLVLGLHRAVLAEGLEFARHSGLDPARALAILQAGPAASRIMAAKGPKMVNADFTPEARLAQHAKDVGLMLATAGAYLPLTTVHQDLLARAIAAGWGAEDNSALIKVYQEQAPPEQST